MAKSTQPAWAGKLRKQLKRAGEEDRDLSRFGADQHEYQLKPPASAEAVAAFEARFHVSLPDGYRNCLLWMGNGGAGPFYGLYSLGETEPGQLPDYPSGAVLPLGTQGCTLMTGLVLDGPDRGRVIYYDTDECDPPTVMREPDFLAWYDRWTREVIAGYDDEEMYFDLYLDGNRSVFCGTSGHIRRPSRSSAIQAVGRSRRPGGSGCWRGCPLCRERPSTVFQISSVEAGVTT